MDPTPQRLAAGGLAALGAGAAVPIPLAQLDFAGVFNVFNIDHGDAPRAVLLMAGIGGALTVAVIGLALLGAVLVIMGSPAARRVLICAAVAGLVTAMPLWIPAGVVIGAAALLAPPHVIAQEVASGIGCEQAHGTGAGSAASQTVNQG